MALYTEETVKACLRYRDGKRLFFLSPNDRLTPAAREWLTTNRVEIVPQAETPPQSYTTLFGGTFTEKPEHMTHLRGNLLVEKTHPRIAFRGQIDSLEAELLLAIHAAHQEGFSAMAKDLSETLDFTRRLIRCDVLEEPLGDFRLCGLDAAQLRERSHYPQKYYDQPHFMPDGKDSLTLLRTNKARTIARQAELSAYHAFASPTGGLTREDILLALNRLSSMLWIFVIRLRAKGKEGRP